MSEPSLDREHVVWAYRLLLDRDPESEQAIAPKLRAWRTTRELRTDIMSSAEFRLKNPDAAQTGRSTFVIKPIGDARLWIDLADHVIGLPILRDEYEPEVAALARSLLGPGDVAVDVGAHIGFFAVQFAQAVGAAGMVHAFEPLARNADLLERSIAESGFTGRMTLVRAAVSDRTGEATLRFARETLNTGGAFLGDRATGVDEGLEAATVPTIGLDEAALRRPVRLLKMDVEGAEPLVVRGARRLLAADRPHIVSEVHPEQLRRVCGESPAGLFAELAAYGYEPRRIEGGRPGPPVRAEEVTGVATVLFVPR
jgi:FkbM family methyltransferase